MLLCWYKVSNAGIARDLMEEINSNIPLWRDFQNKKKWWCRRSVLGGTLNHSLYLRDTRAQVLLFCLVLCWTASCIMQWFTNLWLPHRKKMFPRLDWHVALVPSSMFSLVYAAAFLLSASLLLVRLHVPFALNDDTLSSLFFESWVFVRRDEDDKFGSGYLSLHWNLCFFFFSTS